MGFLLIPTPFVYLPEETGLRSGEQALKGLAPFQDCIESISVASSRENILDESGLSRDLVNAAAVKQNLMKLFNLLFL